MAAPQLNVFNVTNHFNPGDHRGSPASGDFSSFYHSICRKYGMKFYIEKK